MDPVATTLITADFCLVAPCDKTGHNVINNRACQKLNSEQIPTTRAIFLDKKHSIIIGKIFGTRIC